MVGAFPFSAALPITVPPSVSVSSTNTSSRGQVVVNGTGVNFNFAPSSPIQANQGTSDSKEKQKPFVFKLKTKQIRICQSCRKDYDGTNDTLGLVVARAERRLHGVKPCNRGAIFRERKQLALPCSQKLLDKS